MDSLVTMALVGTAKSAGTVALEGDHPADALFRDAQPNDREQHVLILAGTRAVCERCGQLPRTDISEIPPAAHDKPSNISPKLLGILQNALATNERVLLCEFLRELKSVSALLPPELLPQALGVGDATVRECLLPVLGERGRWLSRLRSEWRWVQEGIAALSPENRSALKSAWEEGTAGERRRALEMLRRSDPGEARDWLQAVVDNEKADQRAALLETFEHGLSLADEPFLEERLNDRSEHVRLAAAKHLAKLPGSALSQRMAVRAEAMLSSERTGIIRRKTKLTCSPPEEIDNAWERDGIAKKPPTGRGKRAFWAELLLALVPPGHWSRKFALDPTALIEAVHEDTFEDAVIDGWTQAAADFATADADSAAWLLPLTTHWLEKAQRTTGKVRTEAIQKIAMLLPSLSATNAEKIALELLADERGEEDPEGLRLLASLPRYWSAEFGSQFLRLARNVLYKFDDNRAWQWMNALGSAGRALPRETFAAALEPWDIKEAAPSGGRSSAIQREIDNFAETIRTRQSFFAEIGAINAQP